jgi:hypothetical protein
MEKNKCCLSINPLYDKELSVKIKRYQKNNIFIQTKIINCNVLDINYNEYNINSHKICNLIVLNTEKYIKSIGIFDEFASENSYNEFFTSKFDPSSIIKTLSGLVVFLLNKEDRHCSRTLPRLWVYITYNNFIL